MRERATSADLAGASVSVSWPDGTPPPTDPGTRLALGTRLGSPAGVVSPAAGDATTWAARQPSSAGEVHVEAAAGWAACGRVPRTLGPVMLVPLRRNQSDSSESKIGSRWSWVAAGGMVTEFGSAAAPSVPWPVGTVGIAFVAVVASDTLGPSPPRTFWPPIGDCGS